MVEVKALGTFNKVFLGVSGISIGTLDAGRELIGTYKEYL